MDYKYTEDYIDKYLKKLAPFRDNRVYQGFVSLLRNYYLKDSYQEIPASLKEFVEEQKINTTIYDRLLIGAGLSTTLVNKLRTSQKKAIIDSMLDYFRYPGSIKYINQLCSVLDEGFNVYELYADYRLVLGQNGNLGMDWIMLPKPIYISKEVELTYYDYAEIYNATPTYYVSIEHLEMLRTSGSITLPFKTNLIILDMHNVHTEDSMIKLTNITTLHYFKELVFSLYTPNNTYDITISEAYQLWFYLLFRYYGSVSSLILSGVTDLIVFNINSSSFPYTLEPTAANSIVLIQDTYDNLPFDKDAIQEFYDTYFSSDFLKPTVAEEYNLEDIRKKVLVSVGNEIVKDLEKIMDDATSELDGILNALGCIEDSIHSYIYTSEDPLLLQYETNLMNMFPSVLIDPEETATYQMVMEFKPFHTQLISTAKYYVTIKDKVGSNVIKDTNKFVLHEWPTSSVSISDSYTLSHSIETGYFVFDNTNIIKTDLAGMVEFSVGDLIYARNINTNIFPIDTAQKIISIYSNGDGTYSLELENAFTGLVGEFPRAYKFYPPAVSEQVELGGTGFFSFTTVLNANEVHTNEIGFVHFGVGDYIYAPVDNKQRSGLIVAKDYDTFSFILKEDYTGTEGVWSSAVRWRPAP